MTPSQRERFRVLLWSIVMVGGGLLLLIFALAGCGSTSRITPATSTAAREIAEKRPRTTWRVIVEPRKEAAR